MTGSGAGDSDDLDDDELEQGESHDGNLIPVKTTFELADTLYAEAELEETDTVYLWLGVRFFHGLFLSVLSLNKISTCAGECYVVLQNTRGDRTPQVQT